MAIIGLSNVQIRSAEGNFVPVCTVGEIKAAVETDPPEWWQDITSKPISQTFTIKAKRNGTIFERCLYYKKNKKKRIRKKWDINRKVFHVERKKK